MALLGIDLGGTKLALAILSGEGKILRRKVVHLEKRRGGEVGQLISGNVAAMIAESKSTGDDIVSAGISVPGISHISAGTVWAPNIPGWDAYPLLAEIQEVCGDIPVAIDSDRACYILGESWLGNARGCRDAVFLSVGTGIGAGIMVNGSILRGSNDIAGCIGWMALQRPFDDKYKKTGCFEYYASGEGITGLARIFLTEQPGYSGELGLQDPDTLKTADVFDAFNKRDPVATKVIGLCVEFWGMAVANLVSLFNPQKIIFGGGVFGPAASLLSDIKDEAFKWAQPVSMKEVDLDVSALAGDAGVCGAGYLALNNLSQLS